MADLEELFKRNGFVLVDEKRKVYTLPFDIEQSIIQEWELPETTYDRQDYANYAYKKEQERNGQ